MASLTEALASHLPEERIHLNRSVGQLWLDEDEWTVDFFSADELTLKRRFGADSDGPFNDAVVATSLDAVRNLVRDFDPADGTILPSSGAISSLLPAHSSSAILVAFTWAEGLARSFTIPSGFGFLVPQTSAEAEQVLACTFVDQKFPHRAPEGARVMRAFFGGESAESLSSRSDEEIAAAALRQLRNILGSIPEPSFHTVRRWPRRLPQYEVGHLERIAELERLVAQIPGLHLLGNSYRGVGIPDLIRDARATARAIAKGLQPVG
jgi:oxygen-dependent protoporphyrinogen oxidase